MSFEVDITILQEMILDELNEGFAEAKRQYVDTGTMMAQPDGTEKLVKMPLQVLKRLAGKDPTYPAKGKYVSWIAKQYLNPANHSRALRQFDILVEFERLVRDNKIANKQVDTYPTIEALGDAVNVAHQQEEHKKQAKVDRLATKWDISGEEVPEEIKRKREQAKKDLEFRKNLKIDTAVIGLIDTTPTWNNPQFELKVDGHEIVVIAPPLAKKDDPEFKEHRMMQVEFTTGPLSGKTKIVTAEQITGNTGDLYWQNEKVVIACPHSKESSELYGRNTDFSSSIKSNWCTATPGRSEFTSYWAKQGNVLFYILPKSAEFVPIDPDPRRGDRFAKVAIHMANGGAGMEFKVLEIRDRYNKMINFGGNTYSADSESSKTTWTELADFWGLKDNNIG